MKKYFILLLTIFLPVISLAVTITRKLPAKNTESPRVGNINSVSTEKISKSLIPLFQSLDYIENNYSDKELKQLVVSLNKSEISAAKQNNTAAPEPLSSDILNNRQKMLEYLHSYYKY